MPIPAFHGVATVVGSFPHRDAEALVGTILRRLPAMPAWPQLPARDFRENMYVQYSEGLPGAVVDRDKERLFFRGDGAFSEALEGFYEAVLSADVDRFAIGRDHAAGLHALLDSLARSSTPPLSWVKGQVTGPFSFAMTVTDEGKRALAYTPELYEVAVQGMTMKARWMARTLRAVSAEGALVVLDEPYLCSFGSAFVNVSREDVSAALDGAAAAIHEEGALCGLHCCGNTDWSLVLGTRVDVVNFDAHDYFQGLSLYPTELRAFLERGGILSWGIVPTSGAAAIGAPALACELEAHLGELERKGLSRDRLRAQSLLTPACGVGSRTVAEADQVLDVLTELTARWQG